MRTVTADEPCGDAWERIADLLANVDVVPDHGDAEKRVMDDCRTAVPISRVPTSKLKTALITVAVHFLRSGGERIIAAAADVKKSSRLEVLSRIETLISRSEEDSQMVGIAIEYSLH